MFPPGGLFAPGTLRSSEQYPLDRQVCVSKQTCDVAVIGGGPAGSATALFLARRGYEVILFDRDAAPRPKPCGEYLTPGAVGLLRDTLGVLPQMRAQGAMPITRETVVPHNGRAFGGETQAIACPRTVTDAVLRNAARAAGVQVMEEVSVRDVLRQDKRISGVRVRSSDGNEWDCCARVTVGADGTRSLLARTLGVVRPLARLQHIALVGHFQYPEDDGSELGAVTMHLASDKSHACCGVGTPCGAERTRNVNIVVPLSEGPRLAGRRPQYFADCLRTSFPRVYETWQYAVPIGPLLSVPCFGHHTARATGDGAVLVGDAATFIHPFTGEGVFFALRGAELAAQAIDTALSAGDVSQQGLQSYDAARARELLPRYRLCDAVQRVVHSPALLGLAGTALRRSPSLTQTLLRAIGDITHPRDLFLPPAVARAFS